jgi:transposase
MDEIIRLARCRMKGFELNQEELAFLRKAHKSEHYKRSAYKINAIILLGSGWTLAQVKDALLIDDETLRNYVKKYQDGGLPELLKVDYKGSEPYLSIPQLELLCQELDSNIFLTTQAVVEFVEIKFKVIYSQSGMRDLLHRLGYEYKKPKLVPGNPDKEAQEIFVQQYDDFMLNKPEDAEVLFLDAVHPQHNTMAAYGWLKRGESREIQTNSGRERLNLHGAMNAETLEVTIIESESVDDDSTVQLLSILENKYLLASTIYVILDNARYHYSRKVQRFLRGSKIKLIFLPSYSPNLNLIERLWKFFKKKVLYNTYYSGIDEFRQACIKFFKNIEKYNEELSSIMSGEFELA